MSMPPRASGLIPAIPAGRMVQIGNAAIEGATIALLSRAKRQELELWSAAWNTAGWRRTRNSSISSWMAASFSRSKPMPEGGRMSAGTTRACATGRPDD